ncbi:MAG: extracellular solute-binding protein [Oscillospiraceae bacterium]|nr:extracellular solute-binding protein [Oscillospiraceae bacterium]
MKRWFYILKRAIATILATSLLFALLAGCRGINNDTDNITDGSAETQGNTWGSRVVNWSSTEQFDTPEFLYLTEYVEFPNFRDIGGNIRNIILKDGTVYFTAGIKGRIYELSNDHGVFRSSDSEDAIFFIDTNTKEIIRLPEYRISFPPEEEVISYMSYITAMHVDNDGNIWIAEYIESYYYEDFDNIDLSADRLDVINNLIISQRTLNKYYFLRKLDADGADLIEPFLVPEMVDIDFAIAHAIHTDEEGNIYFAIDYSPSRESIFIYQPGWRLKTSFNITGNLVRKNAIISLPNGNIIYGTSGGSGIDIQEIDTGTGARDRSFTLPISHMNSKIFPGNDEYPVFYTGRTSLSGFDPETEEKAELLSWIDSGINENDVYAADILDDGRIMLVLHSLDISDTWEENLSIQYLKRVPFDELQDRTLLTLAAFNLDNDTRDAVTAFNRASNTHVVQVIDYSKYNTGGDWGWLAALDKLALDLTTGKIPDMISITDGFPLQKYAIMGLFEDLYPFIDSDPDFSRDSFVDGLLEATEINGNLYRLFPNFAVLTLIGNPYFLGNDPGWDMDEFQAVLRNNPQADKPLGSWATSESFFESLFLLYVDQFIDMEAATADFNNERFIRLLESMAFLPQNTAGATDYTGDPELIATGRQIMYSLALFNFEQYKVYRTAFGGDIVFKGYPSDDGIGNILWAQGGVAMTVTCADKAGAWEFIRSFLTPEEQRKLGNFYFSANNEIFTEMLEKAMIEPSRPHNINFGVFDVPSVAIPQEEATQIRDLIATTAGLNWRQLDLWYIVQEESSKYFRGQTTAQEVARIIQSRTAILMSEQYG